MKLKMIIALLVALLPRLAPAQQTGMLTDTYETAAGPVEISLIGYGSLMIGFDGKVIHVDPNSRVTDYTLLSDADLILITDESGEYYDTKAMEEITTPETLIITNSSAGKEGRPGSHILSDGDRKEWNGIDILAVPSSNSTVQGWEEPVGEPTMHEGNGYVLTFGDFRVYVAGAIATVPDSEELEGIHVAFLPRNLNYTLGDEQFIENALKVRPVVLYPYHYSEPNNPDLETVLPGIKLRW